MDSVVIDLSQAYGAFAIFIRVGAFVVFMPFVGSPQTPPLVKLGFIVASTAAIYGVLGAHPVSPPTEVVGLTLAVARELILGAAMGLSLKLLVAGSQLGGQVDGLQMGFSIENFIDPTTGAQLSIMAQWVGLLALWVLLTVDAHHWLIQAMVDSFRWIPPYQFRGAGQAGLWLMDMGRVMFELAIRLCAPIMGTLLLTNLVLGILSRAVPQVNVYLLSFPLTITIGLLVLGFSMPLWTQQLAWVLNDTREELFRALQGFSTQQP